MKLVIHPPIPPERLERVAAAAAPMVVVNAPEPGSAAAEIVDADAFFGRLTPELLAAARRLAWVQSPTASLEHYVFPELVAHPCVLTNMRGLYSDVIADHVYGYLLCVARNLHRYVRSQAERRWQPVGGARDRQEFVMGPAECGAIERAHGSLADTTLGIVGLGAIGSEIARRAPVFGMRVLAVDARRRDKPPEVEELWGPERLDDLLAASDHVVIAAPHTPATAKLFRRAELRRMKPHAILVNIGRGAIVDLDDLTAALRAGEIGGAALDVYEVEPLPADHPLWGMENVVLTPHVAGASPRIAERHLAVLLDNVARFARGAPLVNVVDKSAWF